MKIKLVLEANVREMTLYYACQTIGPWVLFGVRLSRFEGCLALISI